jgi:membrane-associated phospholipid phosphatase
MTPPVATPHESPEVAPAAFRRFRAMLGVALLVAFPVALAADRHVATFFQSVKVGGDVRRELEFIQQFGAVTSCLVVAAPIALLDPARRSLLPRAALAIIATSAAAWTLKVLVGRPRPRLEEPYRFLGPWNDHTYSKNGETVTMHAWEFWRGPSDLWSMPSSHTAAACALAVVIARLYPRLTPLMIALACIVGAARVVLGAHYPSDVVIGAALGATIASLMPLSSRRLPTA